MNVEVVDTNVVLVANGQHGAVSRACIKICVSRLLHLMSGGVLAIDDGFEILKEYLNKTDPARLDRPGDQFVKWALNNRSTARRVHPVALRPDAHRGYESFPDDPDLKTFDKADCKFVAVSRAHGGDPPILQATDTKWLDWAPALRRHGVKVDFLCPHDIASFAQAKVKPKSKR